LILKGNDMSTYDETIISDLHKDVYGFRPRQDWWANWKSISEDAKQAIWDYLCEECDAEIAAQKVRDEQSLKDFMARVDRLAELGAPDRDTAIRWIVEGLELTESDLWYGAEYVCHRLHLSLDNYGMFKDAVDELIARNNYKFSMEG
jgi:hypothetical protein